MKVKRNLPREHPQLLEGRVLRLFPPAVTWSCTSQGCLLRQTGFIFAGMDVKLLYTPPSLHRCFLSIPSPSVAQEERQKGVCRLWRKLEGLMGWQELFLWKPSLAWAVVSLLCSGPLGAALRLLPLIPPRAGPSPKGDSPIHLYCRVELKGVMEHLPALCLPEIPRKPFPSILCLATEILQY